MQNALNDRRTGWGPRRIAAPVLITLIAMGAALAGVFHMPVLDRDEARFAQATAQMLESGDYIEIRFLDEARHKKPVGIHWMQAASVAAVSDAEARAIWAYRLPSVLGAVLAALFTYGAGRALAGRPAAFAGGVLVAASVLLGVEGGIAKTDALLTTSIAGSFWAIVQVRMLFEPRRGAANRWALAGWAFAALGVLLKGPVAPLAIALGIGALVVLERRLSWLKSFFFWPGPVLAAAMVLPWFIAIQIATEGAFLREALGEDFGPKVVSGHEGHGAPPGTHLALLPILIFPATLFLPAGIAALVRLWREAGARALTAKTLVAWSLPIWLVFEIAPTKLPHYTLPAYPALALIAGLGIAAWSRSALWLKVLGGALFLLGGLPLAAVMGLLGRFFGAPEIMAWIAVAVFAALSLATLAASVRGKTASAPLALALIAALSWHALARGVIAPQAETLHLSERAAAAVAACAPDGAAIVSAYTEPSFAFALGGDVIFLGPREALDAAQARQGPVALVEDSARAAQVGAPFPAFPDATPCALVEGLNYSRGDETIVRVSVFNADEPPLAGLAAGRHF